MPAGKGGAGCGAKGFAGSAAGAGVGEGVCANAFAARHELKTIEAANNWKVILRTRFIVAPLKCCALSVADDLFRRWQSFNY
jgi:hypothetical protein